MKKALCFVIVFVMLFAIVLIGCEKKEEEVGADIDTQAALQAIYDNAKATAGEGAFFPFTMETTISNENCESLTGLTAEQFDEYVIDAYSLPAALNAQAFDLALIKCKDYAAAKEIKKLIAEQFNPSKRICATSELAFVVESGRFVLLGGVAKDTAEFFQKAFDEQFETKTGEVNTFFEKGDEAAGEGGLGGGLILP